MKIWITKYALSSGIEERECEVRDGYAHPKDAHSFISFKIGRDAHTLLDDAKLAAEKARLKKIESLRKQLALLERKEF